MSPEEKKLEKLQKLFEVVNEDYATPEDVIKLGDAIIELITAEKERVNKLIDDNKQEEAKDKRAILAVLDEKERGLKAVITRLTYQTEQSVATVDSKLSKSLSNEVKRLERKIPTKTELRALEDDIQAIRTGLNSLPTEFTINNEAIRDGLELLQGDERLDVSAIKGIDKLLASVDRKEAPNSIGVKLIRYLQDVDLTGITNGQTLIWNSTLQRFLPGSAGSGSGHTIEDEGTPLTQRTSLNFVGAGVTVTDDAGNDATVVTIPGGGSSSPGGSDREVQFNDAGVFGGSAEVIMPEASDVKLKVTGSAGGGFGYIIQTIENTNSGGRAELSLDTDDGAFAGFITMAGSATTNKARQFDIGTRMAGDMGFWTNNLEQMTLTDAGRLGIGTDNPLAPLDVRGDARVGASSGTATISLLAGSTRSATIAQQGASAASPLVINTNGAIDIQTDAVSRLAISDTGQATFSQDVLVPDEAYDATAWNGSLEVPTKNAIRDKIESMSAGSGITRTVVVTSGSATMGAAASTDYVYFVAGAHTMSLPAAAGNTNRYTVKNNHSSAITIDTAGAENVEGAASVSLPATESYDLASDGTNWFIV